MARYPFVAITAVGNFCAFLIVPSLSMGAISPLPRVLEDQNLEAVVEGGIKKMGVLEASRSLAREATEGRDCLHIDNETTDCRETQFRNR